MCDEREQLIGYVYDECDADERQRVDDHLESCSTCRQEIAALRDVRQDLLAWRVPDHDPIWRPVVAPAPPIAWWRQVPAWALAAAASVTFLAGALGGAMVQAWVPRSSVVAVEATPPRATPAHVGVTAAELSASQQQLLQMMREELGAVDRRVRSVSTQDRPAPRVTPAAVTAPETPSSELILSMIVNDLATVQSTNDRRYSNLAKQLDEIRTVLAASQGGR